MSESDDSEIECLGPYGETGSSPTSPLLTNGTTDSKAPLENGHAAPSHGNSVVSLRELVDQMERNLAMALKDYRQRAEEILEDHYEVIEQSQNQYEHTISLLRSENVQLRKMVGQQDPKANLSQPISMFQTQVVETANDKKNAAKAARHADDDKQVITARNKRGKQADPTVAAGGTWQQFMAWVPNGAALQQAEPWKPLPQHFLSGQFPPQDQHGHDKKHGGAASKNPKGQHGILPGSVDVELEEIRSHDEDDSEAGSSDASALVKEQLEVGETWKPTAKEAKKFKLGSRASQGDQSEFSRFDQGGDDAGNFQPLKPRYILDPDSNIRISWDLSSLFMVVYDMIMIPMMSFDMPENAFSATMDWTTRLFWTLDMGWSCCTGVVLNDGSVEYNFKHILRRYAKSWLPLDVFIVASDWSGLIFSSGGMGLSKLARASRVARVVRLLRLVRMQEIVANMLERIQNDKIIMLLHVLKLMLALIVACHVMACLWWSIGDRSISGDTWVSKSGYANADVGLCYLASLHWSLAQFGGGMENISPANGLERFFAIVTGVLAFIAGIIMLSVLTSTMTQQYIIGGSGARQMATLKKYLQQNRIPKNLVKRVCRNAKHAISGDLTPDTVDLLHVVSEPLQIEMHFEMYCKTLANHPFFMELMDLAPHLMRRICHLAMSTLWLASGDVLFVKGEEPAEPKMYFCCSGMLHYLDDYGEKTPVTDKMWLAEGTLWTSWRHLGTLTAVNDVKLALLDAQIFQEVSFKLMKKAKQTSLVMKRYAAAFVEDLNKRSRYTDLYES